MEIFNSLKLPDILRTGVNLMYFTIAFVRYLDHGIVYVCQALAYDDFQRRFSGELRIGMVQQ